MGYSTDFTGSFDLTPALTQAQTVYINKFSNTRRIKRHANHPFVADDPIRLAVGLPVGVDGGFCVAGGGFMGQERDDSIVEYNTTPIGQPDLWCKWITDGKTVQWSGMEKFRAYTPWLVYMIEHFFKEWGVVMSGEVDWQGENEEDFGRIYIEDNRVQARAGVRDGD